MRTIGHIPRGLALAFHTHQAREAQTGSGLTGMSYKNTMMDTFLSATLMIPLMIQPIATTELVLTCTFLPHALDGSAGPAAQAPPVSTPTHKG